MPSIEKYINKQSDGPHPTTATTSNDGAFAINPMFEATIDTSNYPPGTKLAIFANASRTSAHRVLGRCLTL